MDHSYAISDRSFSWQKPAIKIHENRHVIKAVRKHLHGSKSECDLAFRTRTRRIVRGCHDKSTLYQWRTIVGLHLAKSGLRKRRLAVPAALRQLGICFPELNLAEATIPTLQLVPQRRHASSGFPMPIWLEDYGVSPEDWQLFTERFELVNDVTMLQSVLCTAISLAFEVFVFAAIPTKLLGSFAVVGLPTYLAFKRRNLRQAVYNGHIPCWTACWNKTYFGPKGLCMGFDLPGPVFHHTTVHPKRKLFPWMRVISGRHCKPMSKKRAARRARITIAQVQDPIPEAGRVPHIDRLKTPRVHYLMNRLFEGPRTWIDSLEQRAHSRMAVIESLRAQRAVLVSREDTGLGSAADPDNGADTTSFEKPRQLATFQTTPKTATKRSAFSLAASASVSSSDSSSDSSIFRRIRVGKQKATTVPQIRVGWL